MKKLLLIVLIFITIILLVTIGGFAYLVLNKEQNKDESTKELSNNSKNEFYKADLNNLILNIVNTRGRIKIMKLSLSLKSTDPKIEDIVEKNKAEFIDKIITLISARTSDELLTLGGKNLLKEELKEDLNNLIDKMSIQNEDIKQNSIDKILFTTFVMK